MTSVTPPDPKSLARKEIVALLRDLTSREMVMSAERHSLHGQIDALRDELVSRMRAEGDVIVISGADVQDDPA